MTITVAAFLEHLTESKILKTAILQQAVQYAAQMPLEQKADDLARELVHRKFLTRFQAVALLRRVPPVLTLKNYVLEAQVWAGRMSNVFTARHRRLTRTVVLKMLAAGLMNSQEDVARFHLEVEVAGKLHHPNIVRAYDADEIDGIPFLVMEHISGVDLDSLVTLKGPLGMADATLCIYQAARGLAHAHQCGVVHSDIKPGNLMLGTDGVVRILDMGLARLASSTTGVWDERPGRCATPMGTTGFHAPEQARFNAPADFRSDLCSLGYTLYFLMTGVTFNQATQDSDHRSENAVPPHLRLRSQLREVPQFLEDLFLKLTSVAPENRYQTADELITELQVRMVPNQCVSASLNLSVSQILETQATFSVSLKTDSPSDLDLDWTRPKSLNPTLPLPYCPDLPAI
jgi:serine/threonine protein kinase